MVAYSFKQRFSPLILSGAKCQTIRAERKRHARVDEVVQLYTGMRTKHCRLIGIARCAAVKPVRIQIAGDGLVQIEGEPGRARWSGLDDFARSDGFVDWNDMRKFWQENHQGLDVFSGIIIRWDRFATRP